MLILEHFSVRQTESVWPRYRVLKFWPNSETQVAGWHVAVQLALLTWQWDPPLMTWKSGTMTPDNKLTWQVTWMTHKLMSWTNDMLTHVMFGSIRNHHVAVSIWRKFGGALAHLVGLLVRRTFGGITQILWRSVGTFGGIARILWQRVWYNYNKYVIYMYHIVIYNHITKQSERSCDVIWTANHPTLKRLDIRQSSHKIRWSLLVWNIECNPFVIQFASE